MHAPDRRERFPEDPETSAPHFPLPADGDAFAVFAEAGEELMRLRADCDQTPEMNDPIRLEIKEDDGEGWDVLRISPEGMRWNRVRGEDGKTRDDLTRLKINDRAALTHIPPEAHDYKVAGRSPLQWAVRQLGFGEDPNNDPRWHDDPLEMITHLRRPAYVGHRTAEIVAGLPPSLGACEQTTRPLPQPDPDGYITIGGTARLRRGRTRNGNHPTQPTRKTTPPTPLAGIPDD